MKKIILLFAFSMLFSCSKSDSNTSNSPTASSTNDFHPPSWIQGNYKQTIGNNVIAQNGFNFSSNDLVVVTSAGSLLSQQGSVNSARTYGSQSVTVIETITNTLYSAQINYPSGQSVIYAFDKISSTKIKWQAAPTAEFTKQ
ncbi:MAG: hypothetical protein H7174_10605 [Flavobacterium sp.]|nr:hypothetical protein [Flavobacterium sp.]